ncbi:MBL fold metallo-hydrolase [Aquirhabdus parva]|uniref:MBL fold metallo-hydrolase n=1 Tax=Aquirhabdus parva TaxID=2283318 RepID=A0A345P438_9GAMM|nr:MBL fold metallo-hydrolase [Aquirhabdus parva]AXI02047.1 MBL fold metallo-hydrolase [Aquirhabdus parva]
MALWKRLVGLKTPHEEWYQPHGYHGESDGEAVEFTYLGTAGFILKSPSRTLVLDPYVSRPNLRETLTQTLIPNAPLIRRLIPHADDVLVGHAHYDHILDAPELCAQTGARLIGSRAVAMVGRAAGLPEAQIVETSGHEEIPSGTWTIQGLPSIHGRVFGRIPIPGDITEPPPWPPRMRDLKHGLVLNWVVNTGSLRIMHIDSADFIPKQLKGIQVDVLCLCAIGRQYRPNYVKEVIALVKPRWIVPCHWDSMMTPIDAEPDLIPGVDLPGFIDEIREAGVEPLLTPILGKQTFK